MATRMRFSRSLVTAMLLLLAGCSSNLIVDDENKPIHNTHAVPGDELYKRQADFNDCRVKTLYKEELGALSNRRGAATRNSFERGLALSGGGMRAASFTMGVLEALHDQHQLQTMDIVSSVSGGGYTWGWYVTHMTNTKQNENPADHEDKLFAIDGPYQKLIGNRANLTPKITSTRIALADLVPGAILNLFANGLFGWHMNTSPGRNFYEKRLRWTFNTEPVADTGQSTFIDQTWADYRDAVTAGKIPPFVLNDSVLLDDSTSHISKKIANLNYEMTPWHYGNDAFGYQKDPPPVDLSRAISISGGALDLVSITPGFSQKMFISALNLDIGYFIDNPKYERPRPDAGSPSVHKATCAEGNIPDHDTEGPVTTKERFRQVITPFPFYLGKPWYGRHKGGSRLYLSDAGFSDNLGAFSLIRRMTRQIIIVDAEQEHPDKEHPGQGYEFDAYRKLRDAVSAELDADLSVPTIDKILRHEAGFNPATPVMHGTVASFPIKGAEKPVVLQVIYVKLSLNVDDLSKYPAVVKEYYDGHDRKQRFPYESTGDQSYDDQRFRAYRALGWTIGTCIPKFGLFDMEADPPCYVADTRHEGSIP